MLCALSKVEARLRNFRETLRRRRKNGAPFAVLAALCAGLALVSGAMAADLRGHGGPVRAIALGMPGEVITGSFDSTLIRWDLARGSAKAVMRFHDGAVHAVIALPDGRAASAGEDRRIAIWAGQGEAPIRVLSGHEAPISGLALASDGKTLASASWDGSVRLWSLATGEPEKILLGHQGPVNAVAFLPEGEVISAGYDGTLRFWRGGEQRAQIETGLPINALALAGDVIVAAGADGALRFVDAKLGMRRQSEVADVPIVALAASPDGSLLAAAGFRGALVLVQTATGAVKRSLTGPAFPLWSLAFSGDGRQILTGGADRLVRIWSVETGEPLNPILAEAADPRLRGLEAHPGAEIFRACIACHTLGAEDGNRAGPSLFGLMGRKVGSAPDYRYSPALQGGSLIWSPENVAALFEKGPNAMLPGTKMPEQTIPNADDRAALVDFLAKATK